MGSNPGLAGHDAFVIEHVEQDAFTIIAFSFAWDIELLVPYARISSAPKRTQYPYRIEGQGFTSVFLVHFLRGPS